jgi:predicted Zn finger-like uncharacterized protein
MLTRCPHCQTHFRVTPEQLKARQGQVRCGACQGVFNALDSLADEAAPAQPHPVAPLPPSAPEAARADSPPADEQPAPPEEAATDTAPPPEPASEPTAEDGGGSPDVSAAETAAAPPTEEPEAATGAESRRTQDGEAAPEETRSEEASAVPDAAPVDIVEPPPAWEELPPPAPPRRWPWVAGSLLLLALAALQLLFIFRVELAVVMPELRPALAAGCELVGCTLPRPRKPELVGIDASDLAPAGREHLLLTATLKNRAPFDQEYPHLELTLTDTRDAALVRKVLAPADYLPADRPAPAGFAAHGELAVRLEIEAAGVPAVGYRLYLFYP